MPHETVAEGNKYIINKMSFAMVMEGRDISNSSGDRVNLLNREFIPDEDADVIIRTNIVSEKRIIRNFEKKWTTEFFLR